MMKYLTTIEDIPFAGEMVAADITAHFDASPLPSNPTPETGYGGFEGMYQIDVTKVFRGDDCSIGSTDRDLCKLVAEAIKANKLLWDQIEDEVKERAE